MKDQYINRRGSKITPALLATLLWLFSGNVFAAECNFTRQNTVALGSFSSAAVNTNALTSTGTTTINCPGGAMISSTPFILTATIINTTNNLNLKNMITGDVISYSIYRNPTFDVPINVGQSLVYSNDYSLFQPSGSISAKVPIYIRTRPGANISAGTYTDQVTLDWNYYICGGIGVGGLCIAPFSGSDRTVTTVSLTVTKNCLINSTPLVGQFNSVSQSVTLTCTKNTPFQTYVASDKSPGQMKLSSSTLTDFLQYNFYQESGTTLWNETSMQSAIGTGVRQNIPYKAVIDPNQAQQKIPGLYQDNVTLVVVY